MSAHTLNAEEAALGSSLRGPFVQSVVLHGTLLAVLVFSAWWTGATEALGDPNAGGAAVGITAVKSIPLPSRGPQNPVAEDTKSTAPQEAPPPKPQPKAKSEPDPPDAVALNRTKQQPAKPPAPPKYRPFNEVAPNQVAVKSPQAASSPLFTQMPGAGQINTGANTTLGTRYPAYAAQIRELVAREWSRTTRDVNPSLKTAPTVIATFELLRNGSKRSVRILQSSGIAALDLSVRRAIEDAGPFPPMPVDFNDNFVAVEFWFDLKR